MSGVKDYSSTAASNIDVNGVSIAEGMAPSNVNNAMREMMADQAKLYSDTQTGITSTGTSAAYAFATSAGFSTYTTKTTFRARIHTTNAGACTANVDLIGAKNIKVYSEAGLVDPWAGALQNGGIYEFAYASTPDALILLNPTPAAPPSAGGVEYKIINGDFAVNQRNIGAVSVTPSADFYPADRWRFQAVSVGLGLVGTSRITNTGTAPVAQFLRLSAAGQSAAGDYAYLSTRIENARTYAGRTITLFFWAERSSSGNIAVSTVQNFGTGGSPSSPVTLAHGLVPVTASQATRSVTINIGTASGKTFGTNGDDYLEIKFWLSAGSSFASEASSLGPQNAWVDIGGIHERIGEVATEAIFNYQPPDRQAEFSRCQRYYQKYNGVGACGRVSDNVIANPNRGRLQFQTRMRAVPTASFTYDTGTGAGWAISTDGVTQNVNHSAQAAVTTAEFAAEL